MQLAVRTEQEDLVEVVAPLGCIRSRMVPAPRLEPLTDATENLKPRRCSPHRTSFARSTRRRITRLFHARERMSAVIATLKITVRIERTCKSVILSTKPSRKNHSPLQPTWAGGLKRGEVRSALRQPGGDHELHHVVCSREKGRARVLAGDLCSLGRASS